MENQSRIPVLNELSFDGALMWFSQLQCAGLLFHPEDNPETIILTKSGEKMFTEIEVTELRQTLDKLDESLGHEKAIEAAYPIFMNATGQMLDA